MYETLDNETDAPHCKRNWFRQNSKYIIGGIIVVLVGCIGLSAFTQQGNVTSYHLESRQYGKCECNCAHTDCDFPKSKEECEQCNSHGGNGASFENGKCWIKVGNISPIDCGLKCYRNFKGCSGFGGVTHYTYGNACWCYYQQP